MVLHTYAPHPHVHVVLKARSELGPRLNIRKATLRNWRQLFATNLRELGVAANATERAVRGQSNARLLDGIYRANQRGESTYVRRRAQGFAINVQNNRGLKAEVGAKTLRATRLAVDQGWRDLTILLGMSGHVELALKAQRFGDGMRSPRTEQEARQVQSRARPKTDLTGAYER
jgi:hypothetical protein